MSRIHLSKKRKRKSKNKERQWKFVVLLFSLIIFFSLFLTEIFYRFYLYRQAEGELGKNRVYRILNERYAIFDEQHGERFPPNRQIHSSIMDNGRLVGCLGVNTASNEDGLGGKTTISEYEQADVKVLTFGDSFTHFNRSGYTMPDLVEEKLQQRWGVDVANLNYGRGSYGILQMFSLAAEKIKVHKPDFVIIQFITDDLTRGRWWSKTEMSDTNKVGLSLMSHFPNGFDNPSITFPTAFIHFTATAQWCNTSVATGNTDAKSNEVLEATEKFYHALLEEKRDLLRRYYLDPLHLFSLEIVGLINDKLQFARDMPRISYKDYDQDERFLGDVETIINYGVPVILLHIPIPVEINAGSILPSISTFPKSIPPLLDSLQRHTNLPVHSLLSLRQGRTLPEKFSAFPPYDGHPSLQGMHYYTDLMTELLTQIIVRENNDALAK